MAYRLTWSPSALKDVAEIGEFIERGSPRYAKIVVRKNLAACEHLTTMPLASAIVRELNRDDVRQLLVYDFRTIVRVSDSEVEIITVIHGARDIESELRRRLQ